MQYDYESIKAEIKSRITSFTSWKDTLFFGVYERLFDVIAYITEKLVYVAEFLYREACLKTAQRLKSVLELIWALGYTPHRKSGAYGEVQLSASPTLSETYVYTGDTLTIPKWTRFSNARKTINLYSTETSTYYNGTIGNINISVKEGVPKNYYYTATGVKDEQFTLYSDSIDNDEVEVFLVDAFNAVVESVIITEKIYFIEDMDYYYCEVNNSDDFGGIIFTFGDGVNSKKLPVGQRVLIKYADTKGDLGNIENPNVVNTIEDIIYDSSLNPVTLYVNNEESISDGTGYEDIDHIRNNAPRLFYTGSRCGSRSDWKVIIENISYVYKATIWTQMDIDGASTLLEDQNKVYVAAITVSGDNLTEAQQTEVSNLLEQNYKSPSEVPIFRNIQRVFVLFNIDAKIINQTSEVVRNLIKNTIYDTYNVLNHDFQNEIYKSNYYSLIDDVANVSHHNTDIKIMEHNVPLTWLNQQIRIYNKSDIPEESIRLVNSSFEIWAKYRVDNVWQEPKRIAYSVDSSILADTSSYPAIISGGTIDYNDDTINFTVSGLSGVSLYVNEDTILEGNGYILCVTYLTEDDNNEQQQDVRLPKQYQITDIDKDFIFISLSN